jgi:glycosyltransferase involved in cell wall biosynthesis
MEPEFCRLYRKELFATPNVHAIGIIKVNSPEFYELTRKCCFVILSSATEGQPGSVVHCMWTGLIPVTTNVVGIDLDEFGVCFPDDNIPTLERVIVELACSDEAWLETRSRLTRKSAEQDFSQRNFSNRIFQILTLLLQSH